MFYLLALKKGKCIFIFSVLFSFLFASCNVEKRVYMPGYHVEWHDFNTAQGEKGTKKQAFENKVDMVQGGSLIVVPEKTKEEGIVELAVASTQPAQPVVMNNKALNARSSLQKMLLSEQVKNFKFERKNLNLQADDEPKGKNLFPAIGLILGLLSLIFFMTALALEITPLGFVFVFLGFVAGLVGALMSGIGLRKSIKDKESTSQKVISIIGLALGFFGFILCILLFWYMVLTWAEADI